jgi:hypothetical protein
LVIQNGACEPATALQPIVSFSKGADAAIEILNCDSNEISIVKLAAMILVRFILVSYLLSAEVRTSGHDKSNIWG